MLVLVIACTQPLQPTPRVKYGQTGVEDTSTPDDTSTPGDTSSPGDTSTPGDTSPELPSIAFLTPGSTAYNPVTLTVTTTGDISRVVYLAEDKYDLGESTDPTSNFEVVYTFSSIGERVLFAHGYDAAGTELAVVSQTSTVSW